MKVERDWSEQTDENLVSSGGIHSSHSRRENWHQEMEAKTEYLAI